MSALLSDFLVRALIGGVLLAAIAGPLGAFVVWRRMSYFGDTMAHSALLGVTISLGFRIDFFAGIFAVAAAVALLLNALRQRVQLPADALLGLLSHAALATGLVIVALVGNFRVDLMGFLFGDILALTADDLGVMAAGVVVVWAALGFVWRPLLADTVSAELAAAEGLANRRARLAFVLLLAGTIALSIKVVGVLLITAMLIIPASTARLMAGSPEAMAAGAVGFGAAAAAGGLALSVWLDTPAGPSIVMASAVIFAVVAAISLTVARASR